MIHYLIYIAVLIKGMLADVCWAIWSKACADKKPWRAVIANLGLTICGLIGFYFIVIERWDLLAVDILGGAVGTYFTVKHNK